MNQYELIMKAFTHEELARMYMLSIRREAVLKDTLEIIRNTVDAQEKITKEDNTERVNFLNKWVGSL